MFCPSGRYSTSSNLSWLIKNYDRIMCGTLLILAVKFNPLRSPEFINGKTYSSILPEPPLVDRWPIGQVSMCQLINICKHVYKCFTSTI